MRNFAASAVCYYTVFCNVSASIVQDFGVIRYYHNLDIWFCRKKISLFEGFVISLPDGMYCLLTCATFLKCVRSMSHVYRYPDCIIWYPIGVR